MPHCRLFPPPLKIKSMKQILYRDGNLIDTRGPDTWANTGPHTYNFGFVAGGDGITVTPNTRTVTATLERSITLINK
jgi:hypothetical protein